MYNTAQKSGESVAAWIKRLRETVIDQDAQIEALEEIGVLKSDCIKILESSVESQKALRINGIEILDFSILQDTAEA